VRTHTPNIQTVFVFHLTPRHRSYASVNMSRDTTCCECCPCQTQQYLVSRWLIYTPQLQPIVVALSSPLPLAVSLWLVAAAHARSHEIAMQVPKCMTTKLLNLQQQNPKPLTCCLAGCACGVVGGASDTRKTAICVLTAATRAAIPLVQPPVQGDGDATYAKQLQWRQFLCAVSRSGAKKQIKTWKELALLGHQSLA